MLPSKQYQIPSVYVYVAFRIWSELIKRSYLKVIKTTVFED